MTPTCEGTGKGIRDGYFDLVGGSERPGGAIVGAEQGIFHLCDFGTALYCTSQCLRVVIGNRRLGMDNAWVLCSPITRNDSVFSPFPSFLSFFLFFSTSSGVGDRVSGVGQVIGLSDGWSIALE